MKPWVQLWVAVLACVIGLGTVVYAQLWVSSGSGVSTAGTMTVTGATALNGGLTMDTTAFTVANGTGNTAIAGTLNVTGATAVTTLTATGGPIAISGNTNGKTISQVDNVSTGTLAAAEGRWFNSSGGGLSIGHTSTGFTPTGAYAANHAYMQGDQTGGILIFASNASGAVRIHTGGNSIARMVIEADGTVTGSGKITSFSAQPGFLAYNGSGSSNVATGTTVTMDTEVYDTTNSFASNTFTAPVTGIYHLCAAISFSDAANPARIAAHIVTSNLEFMVGRVETASGVEWNQVNGCVHAVMEVSDTAFVRIVADATVDSIFGTSNPVQTYFSGRLMP